ncbi:hypothetical protein ZYGNAAKF_CDS0124 [Enterococcus phage VRE9_2]
MLVERIELPFEDYKSTVIAIIRNQRKGCRCFIWVRTLRLPFYEVSLCLLCAST